MKKTVNVEKLLAKMEREKEQWNGYIYEERQLNQLSHNIEKIKERNHNIKCYSNIVLGIEKVEDMIMGLI